MRLKDKVAIITGGNSGIGKATAILFAKEGAKVVVAARTESLGLEVVQTIADEGRQAIFVPTDVSQAEDVKNLIDTTVNTYGKVDVLFNNAGIDYRELAALKETEEQWDKVIDTNLKGVFLCTKYAVPEMLKIRGGSIINNSSVLGVVAGPLDTTAYHASKGALLAFSKKVAVFYAKDNIRVNCILPGAIATPMAGITEEKLKDPEVIEARKARQPLSKVGMPIDVAYAALYFASDESAFVTGASLIVDGGRTAQW